MTRKLLVALLAVFALATVPTHAVAGCCAPGAACCGSPCCK